ncbi:MAG: hypothetical protein O3B43_05655 [Chloroflexi bacterium]|nr:hypothetical protein [Chloroflexota bacterium]
MDNLATLLIAGIAIEALFQVLRPIWEPAVRQEWANFTRLLMLALVLILVVGYSDWNLLAGTGLDLGIPAFGRALTALAVVRITHWVHELYKRTSR